MMNKKAEEANVNWTWVVAAIIALIGMVVAIILITSDQKIPELILGVFK